MIINFYNTKEVNALWCAPSTLDGKLRAEITGMTMMEICYYFSYPHEDTSIVVTVDTEFGTTVTYDGYNVLDGITATDNGYVIALKR